MEALKLVTTRLLSEPLIKLVVIFVALYCVGYMLRMLIALYKPFHFIYCPKCKSKIYRERRNIVVKPITNILGIRHYYCENCEWKGWKLSPEFLQSLHKHSNY